NYERAHYAPAEVKHHGTPLEVRALPPSRVLQERRSIEVGQAMPVLGEMRRHPTHNDADALLMAAVDKIHEVFRQPEARGGRVIAGNLVAPRPGKRMLHDGHQLDVRVAHLLDVTGQRRSQLAIAERVVIRLAQP